MSLFIDHIYLRAYILQTLKEYIYFGQILQTMVDLSQLVLSNVDKTERYEGSSWSFMGIQ